jgi:hypothetical protein
VPREDGFLKIVGKGERAAVARVSGSGARRKWSAPGRRRPSGRRHVTRTRAWWWWRLPHRWRRRRCRPRHKVSGGAPARCVMQGSSVPFSASWTGKGESGCPVFFLPCWFRLQHMAGRRIMYMIGTGKHKDAGS